MTAVDTLVQRAGFPVEFDGEEGALVTSAPLVFNRVVRTKADIAKVLVDGGGIPDDTHLYWIFQLADAGADQQRFEATETTYACVLLPSRKVGREYVKTQGHYHPPMPGTTIEYPEVYSHLFGDIYLLLQRRAGQRPEVIEDFVILDMKAWGAVTIPPGYAHVLINASDAPAAIAGIYATSFKPDYHPFVDLGGAAYFMVDDAGESLIPNPRYERVPRLRRPAPGSDPAFLAPEGAEQLWTSFLENPERYAFVADPQAALEKFGPMKELT
ncbi:MAG: hypothetical protein KF883_09305 [Thermomicrobiales bacterium]|nr:hypothetical protein [Thermomicrobiales bacterium]